jgi:hypothetical protein
MPPSASKNFGEDVRIDTVQSGTMDEDFKIDEDSLLLDLDLTKSTKDHNKIIRTYLSVLDQMEEYEASK